MPRPINNDHNGFLNLYKPPGITSMDAVSQVKRITNQRHKVGHGGTIDPLAQGVLPICFGQATRLMDYVVEGTKLYRMEIKLGVTTTTYDAEGQVTKTGDTSQISRNMVESKLLDFIGTIQQMPPMYSAVKVGGQRLYKLARAGIEVEREARTVMVYSIQLLNFSPPSIMLDVETGRGVYVRSLAHDLGEALGCGGYVTKLERLKCGAFTSSESVTLEQLEQSNTPESHGWHQYLHPIDWALLDSRSLMVGRLAETYIRNGQSITLDQPIDDVGYLETFRAYSTNGHFLALVRFDRAANAWRPTKVFQIDSRSPYAPRNNRF